MPSSAVPGANMISSPIAVYGDGFDALNASLVSEIVCSAFNVQLLEIRHYCSE